MSIKSYGEGGEEERIKSVKSIKTSAKSVIVKKKCWLFEFVHIFKSCCKKVNPSL